MGNRIKTIYWEFFNFKHKQAAYVKVWLGRRREDLEEENKWPMSIRVKKIIAQLKAML